jgi:hypothetical protein
MPGFTDRMQPVPDHGEDSYVGHGRLEGKKTIVTGADSGIGRAVAIAFAREGADVLISYLSEDEDAEETARLVEKAGRRAVLIRGDLRDPEHCREVIDAAVGGLRPDRRAGEQRRLSGQFRRASRTSPPRNGARPSRRTSTRSSTS